MEMPLQLVKWKLGVVVIADCSNVVVEVVLLDTLISILIIGCFGFHTHGGTAPFCLLPFGIFVVNRLVIPGDFFRF